MSNVITLRPFTNVSEGLRRIADALEDTSPDTGCTVICGTDVYQLGKEVHVGESAADAIFNMNFGIHKLMYAAVTGSER